MGEGGGGARERGGERRKDIRRALWRDTAHSSCSHACVSVCWQVVIFANIASALPVSVGQLVSANASECLVSKCVCVCAR